MNYIELINNFWALNKEYSFTPNEKAVYFALLNKCNELGWKNPFNQSNGYLAMDSGMSVSAMTAARNTLQQKGLIKFCSGDGRRINTVYHLFELKKGTKKGTFKNDLSDTLSRDLSHTLSRDLSDQNGTHNTKQQTKGNETKRSKSHSGATAPEQKKTDLLFWKSFVTVWNDWYLEKVKEPYQYLERDFSHLKRIYKFLEKRSKEKNFEFNEENLVAAFKFFLTKAWDKDEWLRQNFSVSNVLSQFNSIANGQSISKNKQQPTGADVSTGSILSKIAEMPD